MSLCNFQLILCLERSLSNACLESVVGAHMFRILVLEAISFRTLCFGTYVYDFFPSNWERVFLSLRFGSAVWKGLFGRPCFATNIGVPRSLYGSFLLSDCRCFIGNFSLIHGSSSASVSEHSLKNVRLVVSIPTRVFGNSRLEAFVCARPRSHSSTHQGKRPSMFGGTFRPGTPNTSFNRIEKNHGNNAMCR